MFLENFDYAIDTATSQPAIITSENVVTYGKLSELVCKMRSKLRESNLSKNRLPILILGERDEYLVAMMLALYLEKIPYVPLSKQYPIERIEYISQSVHSNILLSNDREILKRLKSANFQCFDLFNLPLSGFSLAASTIQRTTAYIIFTSGSTGNPKGVEISYNAVESFLDWTKQAYTRDDYKLLFAGTEITFDLSVFEIFGTLNAGGTFIFGNSIFDLPMYEYYGITMLNTVPSAIRELALANKLPKTLRKINLAGEALSRSVLRDIRNSNSSVEIINLYGPTENTTYSTYYKIPNDFDESDIPIGKPLNGVDLMILNNNDGYTNEPMKKGQIVISGKLLANGYCNDLRKTNAAFQYIYYRNEKIRFYKTGDLGFFDNAGNLHYLGRADSQVKYHGFRIELREIEIHAEENESIKKSVALIKNDNLTLFYSLYENITEFDMNKIQRYLSEKMPEYMVPKNYVLVKKWPLNKNGKIDRSKLLIEDIENHNEKVDEYMTMEERMVAPLWEELLSKKIDNSTDFFEEGGNSIKAMRLVSEIDRKLKKEIQLSDVFRHSKFSEFLKMLKLKELNKEISNYKLNDFQKRLMLEYDVSPMGDEYVIEFQIKFKREIELRAFEKAVNNTIYKWPHLSMQVKKEKGTYFFEKNSKSDAFKIKKGNFKKEKIINPYEDRLVKVFSSDENKTFTFCISHLVFDGYSVNIFTDRLLNEYRKIQFNFVR